MIKERLIYIDTVKGVAMLLVIVFHVARFIDLYYPGYHNSNIDFLRNIDVIYNNFFLAVFFVVSGYFFRVKDFLPFLISNIRTLLLPIFFICYCIPKLSIHYPFLQFNEAITSPLIWIHFFGNWFLGAMFWARLIVYPVYRYIKNDRIQWVILILLSFIGFVADIDFLNYIWVRQGMLFAIYLKIGQWFYKKEINENISKFSKSINYNYITYPVLLGIFLLLGIKIVPIGMTVDVCWWYYPVFLLLSLSGSFMLISICKAFKKRRCIGLIEFIGKNTIIFYIINGYVTIKAIKYVFKYVPNEDDTLMAISFLISIVLANVIVGCIMSYIINTRYLRFIIGR